MITHRRTSWPIVTIRNWKTDAICIFFYHLPLQDFHRLRARFTCFKKNITFFYNYRPSKRFPGDRRGLRRWWKGRAYRGLCSVIITVVVFDDQNNNERLKTRTRPTVGFGERSCWPHSAQLAQLQPHSYYTRKLEFLARLKLFRRCAAQTPRGRRRESMASTDIFLSTSWNNNNITWATERACVISWKSSHLNSWGKKTISSEL